jgi:hypothetical protein
MFGWGRTGVNLPENGMKKNLEEKKVKHFGGLLKHEKKKKKDDLEIKITKK